MIKINKISGTENEKLFKYEVLSKITQINIIMANQNMISL